MKLIPLQFFFKNVAFEIPLNEEVDEMKDFDERFFAIMNKHIAVLALWCFLHIAIGIVGLLFGNEFWRYFSIMSIVWAIINLAIAIWMFNHIIYQRFKIGNVFKRFEVQRHIEKVLFANIGLDIAYIFCGLFFLAISNQSDIDFPILWEGFAFAIIMQAVYLFLQDVTIHQLHHLNFKKAKPFFEDLLESQIAYRLSKTKEK